MGGFEWLMEVAKGWSFVEAVAANVIAREVLFMSYDEIIKLHDYLDVLQTEKFEEVMSDFDQAMSDIEEVIYHHK